jgi:hypothetical protein
VSGRARADDPARRDPRRSPGRYDVRRSRRFAHRRRDRERRGPAARNRPLGTAAPRRRGSLRWPAIDRAARPCERRRSPPRCRSVSERSHGLHQRGPGVVRERRPPSPRSRARLGARSRFAERAAHGPAVVVRGSAVVESRGRGDREPTGASCSSFARPPACSWCAFGSLVRRGPSRTLRREVHRRRRSGHTSGALTRSKDKHPSAVEKIRAALVAEVHHAVVAAVHGEPSTLRVEGPSAVSAALLRVVVGHERALRRSGFRVVECVAVDPDDERGRHGRWRAVVPEDGAAWEWQRTTGEALQEAVMRGDDLRPRPRPIGAEPVATVHSLAAARRARSRR